MTNKQNTTKYENKTRKKYHDEQNKPPTNDNNKKQEKSPPRSDQERKNTISQESKWKTEFFLRAILCLA